MKYLLVLLFLTGCATIPPSLKVGDCVRELGYESLEKITTISDFGGIETSRTNPYKNEAVILQVYNKQQQEKLVKVNCVE